jgi:hypothetical protein
MARLVASGAAMLRRVVGRDTPVERFLRRQYHGVRNRTARRHPGPGSLLLWGPGPPRPRIGIYMEGSCALESIFRCEPLIRQTLRGRCGLKRQGTVDESRTDVVLQTLAPLPDEVTAEARARLRLAPERFRPTLFEPTFTIPGPRGPEEFPKSVVFLTMGADVVRTAYRHRTSGMLLDPGGWWLNQDLGDVLADPGALAWFREHFENIGRISLDAFVDNLSRIVALVRQRTGAHVVLLNVLTVEPGGRTHNYQFVRNPQEKRRREFNLALVELARRLDFPILDVDRILKLSGVGRQLDFNHYGERRLGHIAREAFGILQDLGLFRDGVPAAHAGLSRPRVLD